MNCCANCHVPLCLQHFWSLALPRLLLIGTVTVTLAMPMSHQWLLQKLAAPGRSPHCPSASLPQENPPYTEICCFAADQVSSGALVLSGNKIWQAILNLKLVLVGFWHSTVMNTYFFSQVLESYILFTAALFSLKICMEVLQSCISALSVFIFPFPYRSSGYQTAALLSPL